MHGVHVRAAGYAEPQLGAAADDVRKVAAAPQLVAVQRDEARVEARVLVGEVLRRVGHLHRTRRSRLGGVLCTECTGGCARCVALRATSTCSTSTCPTPRSPSAHARAWARSCLASERLSGLARSSSAALVDAGPHRNTATASVPSSSSGRTTCCRHASTTASCVLTLRPSSDA